MIYSMKARCNTYIKRADSPRLCSGLYTTTEGLRSTMENKVTISPIAVTT